MNSTFSPIFSHVLEISYKRTSCVSLIHMKITRFKVQEDQFHFISSCIYLIKSISALLMRRMHSISVQKQNNLLLFRKNDRGRHFEFLPTSAFPLFFIYIRLLFT